MGQNQAVKELAKVCILRTWEKKKYYDLGNLQKILRDAQTKFL